MPAKILNEQEEVNCALWTTKTLRGQKDGSTVYNNNETGRDTRTPEQRDEADTLLHVMNWVSTCFVKEEKGDVVAAASSSVNGKVTIYLSSNNNKALSYMGTMAKSFKEWNNKLINEEDKNTSIASRDAYLGTIAENSWPRVLRKFEMIKDSKGRRFDIDADRILGYWGFLYSTRGSDIEHRFPMPQVYTDASISLYGHPGRTYAVFKRYTEDFLSMNARMVSQEGRKRFFLKMLCRATHITYFPLMRHMHPREIARLEVPYHFRALAIRLHTRIKKLARYVIGAEGYQAHAMNIFRGLANVPSEDSKCLDVEIHWIPDDTVDNSVKSEIDATLNRGDFEAWYRRERTSAEAGIANTEKKGLNKMNSAIESGLQSLVKRDGKILFNNRFHCELKLIFYLITRSIKVDYNVIGCSKLMCWACSNYKDIFEEKSGIKWDISGSSMKSHYQWSIPKYNIFKSLLPQQHLFKEWVRKSNEDMVKLIKKEARDVLRDRIMSEKISFKTGSDSSTGSRFILFENEPRWVPSFSEAMITEINN